MRPPSLQDLERRLRDRGTEEEGAIQKVREENLISAKKKKRKIDSGQAFVPAPLSQTWHAAWASAEFFSELGSEQVSPFGNP